jgi:competence protein ComEA
MESIKISKDHFAWLVVGFFLGAMALGIVFLISRQSRPAPIYITPASPSPTAAPTETPGPLTVFINGQVASPGVIELPEGSIIQDAIEASGGYTSQANGDVVNLAMPLSNGMHIYVPSADEEATVPVVTYGSSNSNSDSVDNKVNINSATIEDLEKLPGIGPATAQKIIDYRQVNGLFQDIEALMNVSGIGLGKFEQIQELVSLD